MAKGQQAPSFRAQKGARKGFFLNGVSDPKVENLSKRTSFRAKNGPKKGNKKDSFLVLKPKMGREGNFFKEKKEIFKKNSVVAQKGQIFQEENVNSQKWKKKSIFSKIIQNGARNEN